MKKTTQPLKAVSLALLLLASSIFGAISSGLSVNAAPSLSLQAANSSTSASSLGATLPDTPISGSLIVIICSVISNASFMLPPTGFTLATFSAGTATLAAQSIYYKIATASEPTSYTCTYGGTTGRAAIQISVYSGVYAQPVPVSGTVSGNSANYGSGTLSNTFGSMVLVTGFLVPVNSTISSWTNGFTQIATGGAGGNPNNRHLYGSASRYVTTTGSYSTEALTNTSTPWRGQIVGFRAVGPTNSASIVNATGGVALPATFPSITSSFSCQTVNASLFDADRKIRLNNTTAGNYVLDITFNTSWSSGQNTFASGDPAGTGCTNGQMTLDNTGQTFQKIAGTCGAPSNQVSVGPRGLSAFQVDAMRFELFRGTLNTDCAWDYTNLTMSQKIPPETPAGTYTIQATIGITAS